MHGDRQAAQADPSDSTLQAGAARPTILLVHAHPDDESITTGGTLARYAAKGIRTVLVVATGGEAGEISDPSLATPATLAEVRGRELAEAARLLSVGRLVRLGYRDSGMVGTPENANPTCFHQVSLDEAVGRVVALIRAERPSVIVTYDETGGYGHPDHIKANQVTVEAFRAAGDPARYPAAGDAYQPAKLYYTVFPRSQMERLATELRQAGARLPNDEPADEGGSVGGSSKPASRPPTGVADELVSAEIEVGDYLDAKIAAIRAHLTQTGPGSQFGRMPLEAMRDLWTHEYYQLALGQTGAPAGEREVDLFAGLD